MTMCCSLLVQTALSLGKIYSDVCVVEPNIIKLTVFTLLFSRLLNLEACHNVTDYGIQSLTACLQLHKLIISYLDKVKEKFVPLIK